MNGLRFVWDQAKNLANQRKHGVAFEEAQTSFHDERATVYYDPDHSEGEDRFILLGMSFRREFWSCATATVRPIWLSGLSPPSRGQTGGGGYWR